MVLKPTDRLLRRGCRYPLAFFSAERQHKEKGEKTSSFDDVTVFLLTIFAIKLLFSFLKCMVEAHRPFVVPLLPPPARVSSNIAATQKEGCEKITFC